MDDAKPESGLKEYSGAELETGERFCSYPFEHLFIMNSGRQLPCCYVNNKDIDYEKEDAKKISDIEGDGHALENSRLLRKIRRQFIEGKPPSMCSLCFEHEEKGLSSYRSKKFQYADARDVRVREDGELVSPIASLDLRVGNVCNLKCRMCHPASSALLAKEWAHYPDERMRDDARFALKQKDWRQSEVFKKFLRENAPSLKRIYLAGGEPSLALREENFLENVLGSSQNSEMDLVINTNVTQLPPDFEKLLESFRNVTVLCSLDGVEDVNDYIRFPGRWASIAENIRQLTELRARHTHLHLRVIMTVQIYNVFALSRSLLEFERLGLDDISMNVLSTPAYLSIWHLPPELKDHARAKLDSAVGEWAARPSIAEQLVNVRRALETADDPTEFRRFVSMTKLQDSLRNQSWSALNPAFSSFFAPDARNSL